MADWYGTSRSNYFAVKDEAAFRGWAESRELGCIEHEDEPTLFAVFSKSDKGGWPSYDSESDREIDLVSELSKHLARGQIAVLMSSGAEKLRYVTGDAIAVNYKGRVVALDLTAVYEMAAKQFRVPVNKITRAEY